MGGEGRLLCGPCLLQNCMSRTCIEKLQLRIEGGVEKFNLFHKYVIRWIVPHDKPCSIYVHLLAMRWGMVNLLVLIFLVPPFSSPPPPLLLRPSSGPVLLSWCSVNPCRAKLEFICPALWPYCTTHVQSTRLYVYTHSWVLTRGRGKDGGNQQ